MESSVLGKSLTEAAAALWNHIMAHRERYVEAWVAETGLRPSESELVEEVRHETGEDGQTLMRSIVRIRKRTPLPELASDKVVRDLLRESLKFALWAAEVPQLEADFNDWRRRVRLALGDADPATAGGKEPDHG